MNDAEYFERRVGTTLRNKWTLEKLLGVGGMAAVYLGVHKIGRREAIKILHPEIAASTELRQRFEQEAHAVNRFRHAGAVEIRDIDTTDDGAPFLVMELLLGQPLSALVRNDESLAPAQVLSFADQLLDVLAAAHQQGIVHRDIKPDNLFVLDDGRLKVLDFGIARMREGSPKALVTRTGTTIGTISYMPPEQVRGQTDIDGRADLFAVGATMFRLLARRRLHEAASELELIMKMAADPAPSLQSVAPAIPADLCAVVDRALAFERDHRYPTALQMQADVRELMAGRQPVHAMALATSRPLGRVQEREPTAATRVPGAIGNAAHPNHAHAAYAPATYAPVTQAPMGPPSAAAVTRHDAPTTAPQRAAPLTAFAPTQVATQAERVAVSSASAAVATALAAPTGPGHEAYAAMARTAPSEAAPWSSMAPPHVVAMGQPGHAGINAPTIQPGVPLAPGTAVLAPPARFIAPAAVTASENGAPQAKQTKAALVIVCAGFFSLLLIGTVVALLSRGISKERGDSDTGVEADAPITTATGAGPVSPESGNTDEKKGDDPPSPGNATAKPGNNKKEKPSKKKKK